MDIHGKKHDGKLQIREESHLWNYIFADHKNITNNNSDEIFTLGDSVKVEFHPEGKFHCHNIIFPPNRWEYYAEDKFFLLDLKFINDEKARVTVNLKKYLKFLQPKVQGNDVVWVLNGKPAIKVEDAPKPIKGKGVMALMDLPAGTCLPFLGMFETDISDKHLLHDVEEYNISVNNKVLYCSPETEKNYAHRNAFIGAKINEPLMSPLDFIVWVANNLPFENEKTKDLNFQDQIDFLRKTTMNDLLQTLYTACVRFVKMLPILLADKNILKKSFFRESNIFQNVANIDDRVFYFLRLLLVANDKINQDIDKDVLRQWRRAKTFDSKGSKLLKRVFDTVTNKKKFFDNRQHIYKNVVDLNWPNRSNNHLRTFNKIREEVDTPHGIYNVIDSDSGYYYVGRYIEVQFIMLPNDSKKTINNSLDKYLFLDPIQNIKHKVTKKTSRIVQIAKQASGTYRGILLKNIKREKIGYLRHGTVCKNLVKGQKIPDKARLFFFGVTDETMQKLYCPNAHFVQRQGSFLEGIPFEFDYRNVFTKQIPDRYKIPFQYVVVTNKVKKGDFVTVNYNWGGIMERSFSHAMKKLKDTNNNLYQVIDSFRDESNLDSLIVDDKQFQQTFKQKFNEVIKKEKFKKLKFTATAAYQKLDQMMLDTLPEYLPQCLDSFDWRKTISDNCTRHNILCKRKGSERQNRQAKKRRGPTVTVIIYLFPDTGIELPKNKYFNDRNELWVQECHYAKHMRSIFKENIEIGRQRSMKTIYIKNPTGHLGQMADVYMANLEKDEAPTSESSKYVNRPTSLERILMRMEKHLMSTFVKNNKTSQLDYQKMMNIQPTPGISIYIADVWGSERVFAFAFGVKKREKITMMMT